MDRIDLSVTGCCELRGFIQVELYGEAVFLEDMQAYPKAAHQIILRLETAPEGLA